MLTLPIKKKWFDMILHGSKPEEYREIKPYYTARFEKIGLLSDGKPTNKDAEIRFRNGYNAGSPIIDAHVHLSVRTGNPEWGAAPGKAYYVLTLERLVYSGPASRLA